MWCQGTTGASAGPGWPSLRGVKHGTVLVISSTLVIDERNQCARLFLTLEVFLLHEFHGFSARVCDGGLIDVSIQPSAGGQAAVVGGQLFEAIQTSWTAELL